MRGARRGAVVTAITEWAADADQDTLQRLGVAGAVLSESTFRSTLQRLDADIFDELAGQWAACQRAGRFASPDTAATAKGGSYEEYGGDAEHAEQP